LARSAISFCLLEEERTGRLDTPNEGAESQEKTREQSHRAKARGPFG
jgi:hypothetical protein